MNGTATDFLVRCPIGVSCARWGQGVEATERRFETLGGLWGARCWEGERSGRH